MDSDREQNTQQGSVKSRVIGPRGEEDWGCQEGPEAAAPGKMRVSLSDTENGVNVGAQEGKEQVHLGNVTLDVEGKNQVCGYRWDLSG